MTDPLLAALLLAWITACAQVHDVDPAFATAVAICESRPAGGGELEIRVGRLGKSKYYGPFGIHKDFLKRWPIDNPYVNVLVGVGALRGKDRRRVLQRYNTEYTDSYGREIARIERKLKAQEAP